MSVSGNTPGLSEAELRQVLVEWNDSARRVAGVTLPVSCLRPKWRGLRVRRR